jgi:hypothetical protein
MRRAVLLLGMGALLLAGEVRAQWVVTDPGNLAQSIINMSDNIVHTSATATIGVPSSCAWKIRFL